MRADVVGHRLEVLEGLLGLVDNSLVLQHITIMREIYAGRLGFELSVDALCVSMALAEGL